MNFRSLVLVGLLLVGISAQAAPHSVHSSSSANTLSFGVQAGLGFSSLSNYDVIAAAAGGTSKGRMGLDFGVNLEYQLADWIYIQPEIMYMSKGAGLTVATTTLSARYNYLEIPLLLKAKFGNPSLKAEILMGPSFSFAMTRDIVTDTGTTTDLSTTVKSTDFGLHLGAGVEVAVAQNTGLYFNLRYLLGLSDTFQTNTSALTVKNSSLVFLLGARFYL